MAQVSLFAPQTLRDTELLAALLTPRLSARAALAAAAELLQHFGSFGAVLGAPLPCLERHPSLNAALARELKVAEAAAQRYAQSALKSRSLLHNGEALLAYCQSMLREGRVEELHLLFLDRKNQLLCDELHMRGTVDHVAAYPREIVRRALEVNACAVILVHNHPSGDATPSEADIALTQQIAAALNVMGIALHDHLVIGQGEYVSLRARGILLSEAG